MISQSIFKAYDIRGVVGKTLDVDTARGIGRAFGSEVRAQGGDAVVVARDGRLSGPDLVGALADGLRAAGVDVVDVGMVPTPVGYFAANVPLALKGGERRVDSC
ncbi:phosphomannomutase/phosphoglucomutase, partial [Burkholderia contaminans]|nr:phosphomannomutase/phosphoglucomutase [Burkholderia contaminans]